VSVGDVNSNERGSGARYNDGKPDISLIPLAFIAATLPPGPASSEQDRREQIAVRQALGLMGNYQVTGWVPALDQALTILSPYWEEAARVFEYGKRVKYKAWNWAKGMAWSIPLACAGRHALKIIRDGEYIDDPAEPNNGSGLRHVGHFMANLVMLRAFAETYPEGNDLPPPEFFRAPEKKTDGNDDGGAPPPAEPPVPAPVDDDTGYVGLYDDFFAELNGTVQPYGYKSVAELIDNLRGRAHIDQEAHAALDVMSLLAGREAQRRLADRIPRSIREADAIGSNP
jgi:hypothetical protein